MLTRVTFDKYGVAFADAKGLPLRELTYRIESCGRVTSSRNAAPGLRNQLRNGVIPRPADNEDWRVCGEILEDLASQYAQTRGGPFKNDQSVSGLL